MSSGQKAWHDEQVAASHESHRARLEQLGFYAIANVIDDINTQLRFFESDNPSLPRAAWARLDNIKLKLKGLS